MCGILGLARSAAVGPTSTQDLRAATETVRHRGPDDEGYLLWASSDSPHVFAGSDTSVESRDKHRLAQLPPEADWRVALGHRRLSIVDLSPLGHQPMLHEPTGLALCYNGEIYNHVELRRDLERVGHAFRSQSDTEVLMHAWLEWGPACLPRLNGMFAFLVLDPRGGGVLHAVRDRFGVKPLYHARVNGVLAFASEIKQLRVLSGFTHHLDEGVAADYLAFGLVDHSARTFDAGITQLCGGERAVVSLDDPQLRIHTERWYELKSTPFRGSPQDAATELQTLLTDSVRLRLRADVTVGSCLSGGLDSSAIVCLSRRDLDEHRDTAGQVTITACYEQQRFDEWRFAEQVVRHTGAHSVRVWPTIERLQSELDLQLWHMDEPVGSTSQFSQWCVFDGAANAGLKVMLDGQGSDEQLAGYGGSDAAFYTGLLRRAALAQLGGEVLSFRRRHETFPLAQLILAVRNVIPAIDMLLPGRVRIAATHPEWLTSTAPSPLVPTSPSSLNDLLRQQLLTTSLPVLLRYEDRNSMAWSVESRVPFLDYRLVEFLAGVPDSMKLRRGVTKAVFRDAMRGVLPESIRTRSDKMGFVTPEELWLTKSATPWFRDGVAAALRAAPDMFDKSNVLRTVDSMIDGTAPFSFAPWRILCFGRWLTNIASGGERPAHSLSPVHA